MDALENLNLELNLYLSPFECLSPNKVLFESTDFVLKKKELVLHKQSDPFVRAFIDYLYRMLANAAINVPDITNTARAMLNTGAYGYTTVGTSNQAVGINDYECVGLIVAQGALATANQLVYGNTEYIYWTPLTSGTTRYYCLTRPFFNMSGGNIVVEEVTYQGYNNAGGTYYFTMARDLTGTVTINDGCALIVEYKMQVTV